MKVSVLLLAFLVLAPKAAAQPFKRQLRFEAIAYSQLSPLPGVSALLPQKDSVLTLFGGEPSLFLAALKLGDKNFLADMTFEIPSGERVTFDKSVPAGNWRGVVTFGDEVRLLLDGAGGNVMALEAKDMKFISHRQVVADLLRPSADSRGEPTARETAGVRGRFAKKFVAAQSRGLVFSGIVPVPKKWRLPGRAQFLVATHVDGFPLVTMMCDEKDATQCRLDRVCDLAGWRPKDAGDLGAIAVADKNNQLVIVDRRDLSLRVFHAGSCAHSAYVGDVRLPDKLKSPTGVAVDEDGRLWIATEKPDDYRNGSVFMWEKW